MKSEDVHHLTYQLTLGKSGWDLRTLILLNNNDNREYLFELYRLSIWGHLDFYTAYVIQTLTPDGHLYISDFRYLQVAVKFNQLEIIRTKASTCTDINNLLDIAVYYGHIEMVQLLISYGANRYYGKVSGLDQQIVDILKENNINIPPYVCISGFQNCIYTKGFTPPLFPTVRATL